ncbi:MAG: (Fe-S)-binding protein [Ignavibacteriae bacterium]|nr:(Fe-S)-binding protein [Ignavibacteriota bacterium]
MTIRNPKSNLDDILHKCLHCGLCLPVCPTYNLTFNEVSSPRGRIRLMKEVFEDKLEVSAKFVDEMYFCLDCQACQTICPAGVKYGELVEDARNVISEQGRETYFLHWFKSVFLGILSSKRLTKLWARMLWMYQRSGLQEAIQQSEILKLFSPLLHEKQSLLPNVSDSFFDESFPEIIKPEGDVRGRVAFLSGCIMNVAFAEIHRDAIEVLLKNGFEVVIPKAQVCCGSLHGHNGEIKQAKELARKNIATFNQFEFDALIIDAAGCGAFMKEYGKLFADVSEMAEQAEQLSSKTKDITEFLAGIELLPPTVSIYKRVTYHEACHLVHTQKISQQPRQLLKQIPGIEFVELPEATWCCGSAGIYNVLRFEDSMKMIERKMKNLESTQAEIIVTANPGCHLQLQYGMKKNWLNVEVVHPVTLLNRSYFKKESVH